MHRPWRWGPRCPACQLTFPGDPLDRRCTPSSPPCRCCRARSPGRGADSDGVRGRRRQRGELDLERIVVGPDQHHAQPPGGHGGRPCDGGVDRDQRRRARLHRPGRLDGAPPAHDQGCPAPGGLREGGGPAEPASYAWTVSSSRASPAASPPSPVSTRPSRSTPWRRGQPVVHGGHRPRRHHHRAEHAARPPWGRVRRRHPRPRPA